MTHTLKTDPEVFDAVKGGVKTFEIRKDDRGYEVGDLLLLQKTKYTGEEMARPGMQKCPLIFMGEETIVHVTHIMRGPIYGLSEGWVIISINSTGVWSSTSAL